MIVEQKESFTRPQLQPIKSNLHRKKQQEIENVALQVRESLAPPKQRAMDLLCEKGSSSYGCQFYHYKTKVSISGCNQLTIWMAAEECTSSLQMWKEFLSRSCYDMPLWRTTNIKAQRNQRYNHQVADGSMYRCGKRTTVTTTHRRDNILPRSANKQEEARVDIRAKGFRNRQQNAFFDVRVFHPNASSYRNTEIPALYMQQENAKKREYGDRIREVEYAVFTPPVFSTTGGQGKETTIAYKRLAELLATKRKSEYSITLAWMRCSLSFALIRSAVTAIRGSRDVASNRDRVLENVS